jgi:diaminohydroxyphosphoribosylaminopyrimidine deaminase/5-amino-6-(5-phosphoribosylamino)uracil reductase
LSNPVDDKFMQEALRLARRGLGKTSPNPLVGSIIVKDGLVIGRGYYHYFGGRHAEVNAMESAAAAVAGATIYITLEPCSHYGKTPPCADAIVSRRLGRAVIGMLDPDVRVRGGGLEKLKRAGIPVTVGVLEAECRALNEPYIKHRSTGVPFITVKFAQTLDGRIATASSASRGISSAESLKLAHRLRARHDAVLVGAGTVLADDPELTVRLVKGRNPLRVVLDSRLRLPIDAKVLQNQEAARTLMATTPAADTARLAALRGMGVEVAITAADASGQVDLPALMKMLGQRDITSVLVEGGAATITSFLREGLADRLVAIVAPKILGRGTNAVGELNIREIGKTIKLDFEETYRSGADIVVKAKVLNGPR